MVFRKKGEDPWEINPEARRREEEAAAKKDAEPGILDELKEWNAERKAKKAVEENEPPENCPWCGREMRKGYLYSGRDHAYWSPKKPTAFLGTAFFEGTIEITSGFMKTYTKSYLCEACRKLTVTLEEEIESDCVWENGWIKRPEEEKEEAPHDL